MSADTRNFKAGDKVRVAKGLYWPLDNRTGVVIEVHTWTVTVAMTVPQGIKFFALNEIEIMEETSK